MSSVIEVEDLSKAYRIGQFSSKAFSEDVSRFWSRLTGSVDSTLQIGEINDRTKAGTSSYVWSLKDVSFTIEEGQAVGFIGRNGAGKSTLLKLLSRVTSPTHGVIKSRGRIASLLEVGTGFHPELTGRENVFLNGSILGMKRLEIARKFDEIVAFSGVERYIDTPVKRYSSGMYVRLAFAVAAHLDSEILIVDEVLAVGDAEFQKKCMGKMTDIQNSQGRSILFVSHNMASMRTLCSNGFVLNNGSLTYSGDIDSCINHYLSENLSEDLHSIYVAPDSENKDVFLKSAVIQNSAGQEKESFGTHEEVSIQMTFIQRSKVPKLQIYFVIKYSNGEVLIENDNFDNEKDPVENFRDGENRLVLKIPKQILPVGKFFVYLNLTSPMADKFSVDSPKDILAFNVYDHSSIRGDKRRAKTSCLVNWEID